MPKIVVAKHRYQTLAMMLCSGMDYVDIAEAMGLEAKAVERFASGRGPSGFNNVLTAFREKMARASIRKKFEFAGMMDKAYQRIEAALDSNDVRLAADTAWKVIHEVSPPETAPGVSVDINLSRNTQVNAQILNATKDLTETFKHLKSASNPGFEKHLKHGTDALPSAYSQTTGDQEDPVLDGEIVEVFDVPEGEPVPRDHEEDEPVWSGDTRVGS